ncbi:MAG: tyrosine-protein phosphatase [Eubacterium sp.]|nr:tyrosine-protein phosphatase [Eubacterium sp.]
MEKQRLMHENNHGVAAGLFSDRGAITVGSLLQSTRNTRNLPIGEFRYIRSDFPGKLTDAEIVWLREHGITAIIDLRDESEYKEHPCRLEDEGGFIYFHMPVTGGGGVPESPDAVAASYLAMLDGQMDRIVDTILNAKSNVLYFCHAGKDRTGVVSAVILKRLGVDDQTIIDDYMKTKDNLMDVLTQYVMEHPEVDINTIIPREENIIKVLENLT